VTFFRKSTKGMSPNSINEIQNKTAIIIQHFRHHKIHQKHCHQRCQSSFARSFPKHTHSVRSFASTSSHRQPIKTDYVIGKIWWVCCHSPRKLNHRIPEMFWNSGKGYEMSQQLSHMYMYTSLLLNMLIDQYLDTFL